MTWGAFSATDLSAAGLVAIAVLLLFLGGLIPRWVFTQMKKDRDDRLAEAKEENTDLWAALRTSEEARELQAKQLGELLELSKAMDQFIRSLQLAARRRDQ